MNASMVNESMVNKSKEMESQMNKSMVNKSRVNKSMVKVLLLPARCPLLYAPAEWTSGRQQLCSKHSVHPTANKP